MFKMQTNNQNLGKNVAADQKYILRKMGLKFQNLKFNISCKIAFCMFLLKHVGLLDFRG